MHGRAHCVGHHCTGIRCSGINLCHKMRAGVWTGAKDILGLSHESTGVGPNVPVSCAILYALKSEGCDLDDRTHR